MTVIEQVTGLLDAYFAEPGNSGLYIAQAGQPARNVSVEKTTKGIRLVAGQGFWHAAVKRDALDPAGAKRLEAMGFSGGGAKGNYRRICPEPVPELAAMILEILGSAWGSVHVEDIGVLTRNPAVLVKCRSEGTPANAIPGLPQAATQVAAPPSSSAIEVILKLVTVKAGTIEAVTWEYVYCPAEVDPDNLVGYVAMTFGVPLDKALELAPDRQPVQVGWIFDERVFKTVGRSAPKGSELIVIPGFYLFDAREWVSLYMHAEMQRRVFQRMKADGQLSDVITVTPPQAPVER